MSQCGSIALVWEQFEPHQAFFAPSLVVKDEKGPPHPSILKHAKKITATTGCHSCSQLLYIAVRVHSPNPALLFKLKFAIFFQTLGSGQMSELRQQGML